MSELDDLNSPFNACMFRDDCKKLKQQRDTAWSELREIREAIKANHEESTADEVRRVVTQRDKLLSAAKNLRDVKGRHNSEIAMKRLIEAINEIEAEQ